MDGTGGVVTERRRRCAVGVLGGPTTVADVAGLRIVMDPTFDPPGLHTYLPKTAGPTVEAAALGTVRRSPLDPDECAGCRSCRSPWRTLGSILDRTARGHWTDLDYRVDF